MGILNEFPSGITPNIEGGYVVFPTWSEELPPAANWLNCVDPATIAASSGPSRVDNAPVTFDSSDVGHDIVMFEHWGGYPFDVSEMLKENEYRPRISSSVKKHEPLVGRGGVATVRISVVPAKAIPDAPHIVRTNCEPAGWLILRL